MGTMIVSGFLSHIAFLKQITNGHQKEYEERSKDVFGANYERLQGLKAKYDPKNMFNKLFAITPKAGTP
jgi:FAD/FMN-containing dehydrogenase